MDLGKLHVFCHHLSENAVVFYFFVSHQSPPFTKAPLELDGRLVCPVHGGVSVPRTVPGTYASSGIAG